ncbi:hypothetical protein AAY473_033458 [Plecturocebus cupreus]
MAVAEEEEQCGGRKGLLADRTRAWRQECVHYKQLLAAAAESAECETGRRLCLNDSWMQMLGTVSGGERVSVRTRTHAEGAAPSGLCRCLAGTGISCVYQSEQPCHCAHESQGKAGQLQRVVGGDIESYQVPEKKESWEHLVTRTSDKTDDLPGPASVTVTDPNPGRSKLAGLDGFEFLRGSSTGLGSRDTENGKMCPSPSAPPSPPPPVLLQLGAVFSDLCRSTAQDLASVGIKLCAAQVLGHFPLPFISSSRLSIQLPTQELTLLSNLKLTLSIFECFPLTLQTSSSSINHISTSAASALVEPTSLSPEPWQHPPNWPLSSHFTPMFETQKSRRAKPERTCGVNQRVTLFARLSSIVETLQCLSPVVAHAPEGVCVIPRCLGKQALTSVSIGLRGNGIEGAHGMMISVTLPLEEEGTASFPIRSGKEYNGMILAHCNLCLLNSSDSPASAS